MDYSMLLAVHNIDQAARDKVDFNHYFFLSSLQLFRLPTNCNVIHAFMLDIALIGLLPHH